MPRAIAQVPRSHAVLTLAAAALVTAAWTALRWPLPVWMLGDNDWLHQLGGANQILHGEHPFIDWHTDYGPLRYYPSALAQWLLGPRTLAELLLVTLAYTAGYTLLFKLLWEVSGRRVVAGVLLAVALVLAPRLFKYYVLLGPVLSLWAAWRYIERQSSLLLAALAAMAVVFGLFRVDFGAFAGVAAVAAIAVGPGSLRARAQRLARYVGWLLALLAPWFIWLAAQGGVTSYLVDTLLVAPGHAAAMALPFPRFDASAPLLGAANAVFLLYACYFALPAVVAGAALFTRICRDETERRKIITAAALAQAVLVHAAHRSDYSHLLQAIPVSFVLLAWLAGHALDYRSTGKTLRAVAAAAAAVLAIAVGLSMWAGMTVGGFPSRLAGQGLLAAGVHALPREEMMRHLAATHPDDPRVQAVQYLHACTAPTDHIVALPPWIGFYYFADRMFGGTQPNWSPGFFSAEADQQRWIATAQRQKVGLVLGDFSRILDGRSERVFGTYSALVSDYIADEYVPIGRFGPIVVRARRTEDGPAPAAVDGPPACPRRAS